MRQLAEVPDQFAVVLEVGALVGDWAGGVGIDELGAIDAAIEIVAEVVDAHVDIDAAGVGAFVGSGGSGQGVNAGVLWFYGESRGFLGEAQTAQERGGGGRKCCEPGMVRHGGKI